MFNRTVLTEALRLMLWLKMLVSSCAGKAGLNTLGIFTFLSAGKCIFAVVFENEVYLTSTLLQWSTTRIASSVGCVVLGVELNLALNKPAYQSSTEYGGVAERAVGRSDTMLFTTENLLGGCVPFYRAAMQLSCQKAEFALCPI